MKNKSVKKPRLPKVRSTVSDGYDGSRLTEYEVGPYFATVEHDIEGRCYGFVDWGGLELRKPEHLQPRVKELDHLIRCLTALSATIKADTRKAKHEFRTFDQD